ncbi:MBL fold metallo-hydrolase [Micromonospora endophytica]|uniref:MBL fold metallo-hydrolase n=1 Tax=Micromonospora endophytica TaxID=515350 RepID=A0A2W2CTT5_9ACTN|nr:MBL fold metallo-hydrolase [Micromonospora endophytica]PZF95068.1 MBL fold metallo-hydrolase [Micromonospora endophytica]RIW41318.1 MBL fold metallo-hydrolase [Micromonospora endophytica]BCJ62696.1 MBL fold metallo-hydrolase [Micromonospora endophytica]
MRITKYTHACVRLEHDGRVLVIDPGTWSEPRALAGADAVLVSHEHTDHVDVLRLAGLGVPVFVPEEAVLPDLAPLPVARVRAGERFTAAGFDVTAVGGRHATIHGGQPDCANLGYLVADEIYHPGDSLTPPGRPVRTLLVPAQASWLKLTEAIDFAVAAGAAQVFPIHDAQLNERGLASVNGWFSETVPGYRHLAPGQTA